MLEPLHIRFEKTLQSDQHLLDDQRWLLVIVDMLERSIQGGAQSYRKRHLDDTLRMVVLLHVLGNQLPQIE
jgi:hypothetical protein